MARAGLSGVAAKADLMPYKMAEELADQFEIIGDFSVEMKKRQNRRNRSE